MDAMTEETIQANSTEKSFERGEAYYQRGMVEYAVRRGDRLFAKVQGSGWDARYDTAVFLTGDDFTASCTCPYDWGGYCKHIVAVALTYLRDAETLREQTPLEEKLSEFDADRLRALVIRMVERNPIMAGMIDRFDTPEGEIDDCDGASCDC